MDELTFKASGFKTKTVSAGTRIMSEGETSDTVYILREGAVRIEKNGKELDVIDSPGTVLGEISYLLDCGHTASVVAITESSFYVVNDFLNFLRKKPENIKKISRLIHRRLMNSGQVAIDEERDSS